MNLPTQEAIDQEAIDEEAIDTVLRALRTVAQIEECLLHPERYADTQALLDAITRHLQLEGFLQAKKGK